MEDVMKIARKRMQHPVSVLAMVSLTLWTATAVAAAGGVLLKWYGALLMGSFQLPAVL